MSDMNRGRPTAEEMIPENSNFPLPSRPMIMPVTPEMASDWLSYRGGHPRLRGLNPDTSRAYQRLMESGGWREKTPEGLIFDEQGWIISAQHRLKALANAGIILQFWVFPNEPRDIASYIEAPRRRTAADLLLVKYGSQIGGAARHLAALADGDDWGMPRYSRVTVSEVVETYGRWPELTWHTTELSDARRNGGVPFAAHAAVLAQAERTRHRDSIPSWLNGIRTGYDLGPGDPRAALRHRFRHGLQSLGRAVRRDLAYALIVKAWNAHARDEQVSVLRFAASEPLPKVAGFDFVEWEARREP